MFKAYWVKPDFHTWTNRSAQGSDALFCNLNSHFRCDYLVLSWWPRQTGRSTCTCDIAMADTSNVVGAKDVSVDVSTTTLAPTITGSHSGLVDLAVTCGTDTGSLEFARRHDLVPKSCSLDYKKKSLSVWDIFFFYFCFFCSIKRWATYCIVSEEYGRHVDMGFVVIGYNCDWCVISSLVIEQTQEALDAHDGMKE